MRITMFTLGSRGDIEPMIVLGCRLKQAGHTPLLATSPDFAELAVASGLDFAPLGPSLLTLVDEDYRIKKFTAQTLAGAIREAVTNQTMRMKATDLGRRLQAEDGPGRTIELFFHYVEQFSRGQRSSLA